MNYPILEQCRICCSVGNSLTDIFCRGSDIGNIIEKVLPVVVLPLDPLPHKICQCCVRKLKEFSDFYEQSLKADCYFKKIYPSVVSGVLGEQNEVVRIDDIKQLKMFKQRNMADKIVNKTKNANRGNEMKIVSDSGDNVGDVNGVIGGKTTKHSEDGDSDQENQKTMNGTLEHLSKTESNCRKRCTMSENRSNDLDQSALHSVNRIDQVARNEQNLNVEKSVPNLRMRLFSNWSNGFVCGLCGTFFNDRKQMEDHLKLQHFTADFKDSKRKRKQKSNLTYTVKMTTNTLFQPERDNKINLQIFSSE